MHDHHSTEDPSSRGLSAPVLRQILPRTEWPPDSIRSRLFQLCASTSDWTEVLAVSRAIAAKRQEIHDCRAALQCLAPPSRFEMHREVHNHQHRLASLRRELDDWTWPARLSDRPVHAWEQLSQRYGEPERLLRDSEQLREAGWILWHSPHVSSNEVLRRMIIAAPPDGGALLRDPAFLRACLEKNVLDDACLSSLVPVPAILQEHGLVSEIMRRCPSYLRHGDIPSTFFTERDLFEATVQGIRRTSKDADVLCRFSPTLRNDSALVLQTLRMLCRIYRSTGDPSFVGPELCDDKEFCLRVAEEFSVPELLPDLGWIEQNRERRRLLDLSDLTVRLQHNATVAAAFCRLDASNFSLAPERLQCDAGFVAAACEASPGAILYVPPKSPTRSQLECSVPFVVRLLEESYPGPRLKDYFLTLSPIVREEREVSLAAVRASHTKLVHPRWGLSLPFWCDAIRRTESDLNLCYCQIPPGLRDEPDILDALVRHPSFFDGTIASCYHTAHSLFPALLLRVCDRDSFRECVRFGREVKGAWDPDIWRQIPQALWEDKELCLELLSWLPSLYGYLPDRLRSDPDVVAVLLAAESKDFRAWAELLCGIPLAIQLQHPDLVVSVLKGCGDPDFAQYFATDWDGVKSAIDPELWRNREVVLAWFRCREPPPEAALAHFEHDRELWLEVAQGPCRQLFKMCCPPTLLSDHDFMLRAGRAYHQIWLSCLTGVTQVDLDRLLAACTTSLEFTETVMSLVQDDSSKSEFFSRKVRERSSRYLSFSYFVRAIPSPGASDAPPSPPSSMPPPVRSPLGLLNQGPDTAQAYRGLIASFAGVPSGDEQLAFELYSLKQLCVKLARRGY